MIVVDASAVVDALIGDPANSRLLGLLAESDLASPSLLDYEVASALRGHALARRLSTARLDDAVDDFRSLHIERHDPSPMMREILDLRDDFTAYDAAYVVLAQALDTPLVSVDAKLAEARRHGVDVRVVRPERS